MVTASAAVRDRSRALLDEARAGHNFGVFENRAAALDWLARCKLRAVS